MTTEDRPASPLNERPTVDRRVAVLAVIATLVAGVGGAIGGALVTRSATLDAQREAFRQEQVRGDTDELRSVLDLAARNLERSKLQVDVFETQWVGHDPNFTTNDYSAVAAKRILVNFDTTRLTIRLGLANLVVSDLERAGSAQDDLIRFVRAEPESPAVALRVANLLKNVDDTEKQFLIAAGTVAGSKLK
jgi:hypothetical protein